ncbi:ABC transporter substrate-binding protein [Anopheles sinensis]|uniref:ABC transporter substrate-binding protein n=1 Tax=Anopheles sinensis TaxID=74873 RepID=A0A084W5J4_ANOSI|nr:ABC transporter substrate-binding protein [Anopheles sinensis]
MVPLKPPLFYVQDAVTFSRFSPATRFYQTLMNRLFETGVYQRLQRKWYPDKIYREKDATFNDLIVLTEDLVPIIRDLLMLGKEL